MGFNFVLQYMHFQDGGTTNYLSQPNLRPVGCKIIVFLSKELYLHWNFYTKFVHGLHQGWGAGKAQRATSIA